MNEKLWGVESAGGAEIWNTEPVFLGEQVTWRDKLKLIFYPKKWMLYRYVLKRFSAQALQCSRVLDVGCGTGAAMIDLKKLLGKDADVIGVDVVKLQVELANEKIKKNGVWAEVLWYDGEHLPFPDASFDAIYTSDVLGHVKDARLWLAELARVLKPRGALAMFTESKPGKHAWLRNYLLKRGLNIDPHERFHISLYGKQMLKEMLDCAGFDVKRMYSIAWAKLLINPEEYYHGFVAHEYATTNKHEFVILKFVSRTLCWIKKKLHPFSTALCELYCLIEMLTIGRFIEAQGYVVLGRKR